MLGWVKGLADLGTAKEDMGFGEYEWERSTTAANSARSSTFFISSTQFLPQKGIT